LPSPHLHISLSPVVGGEGRGEGAPFEHERMPLTCRRGGAIPDSALQVSFFTCCRHTEAPLARHIFFRRGTRRSVHPMTRGLIYPSAVKPQWNDQCRCGDLRCLTVQSGLDPTCSLVQRAITRAACASHQPAQASRSPRGEERKGWGPH
jgi:hypothetical protein